MAEAKGQRRRAPAGNANQEAREKARQSIREIDKALNGLWNLGRNIVVGWCAAEDGMAVLAIPQYVLPELSDEQSAALGGRRMMTPESLARAAVMLGVKPLPLKLPIKTGKKGVPIKAIESVMRRYCITKSEHRAAVMFDIVGFSLHTPMEQVTLLNSQSYSINVAHSRALANGLTLELGRSTTGDGFYVWNWEDGVDADINLFYMMMLVLADNALARRRGTAATAPTLRTCFHIGSHYEYYQAEGLSPAVSGYIVGNLTIELARMLDKALPGQVLIGSFNRPKEDRRMGGPIGRVLSPSFVDRAQTRLDDLKEVRLSGESISALKCYLTGEAVSPGVFSVKKFSVNDKHGLRRDVFNAKVNIYRGDADAVFLGLEHAELDRFDAEAGDFRPLAPTA